MPLSYDKRLLRVVVDGPQDRVSKTRVGVVANGFNFLHGKLDGMWVSPLTGTLQSIPNSEEPDYQTTNSGRWAKLSLSDVATVDENTSSPAGEFKMTAAAAMHADSAIYYVGTNDAGVGAITDDPWPENTGMNIAQYVYGKGTETDGILLEFGWDDSGEYVSGESVRIYHSGKVEVWRDGVLQDTGAFGSTGAGYEFGSAFGGTYVRASDEYISIRAEVSRKRFLLLTSSKGGCYIFAPPWAIDRLNDDGTLQHPAEPVLQNSKAWFRVPKGGCSVVWSKVQYPPSGTAVSEVFALSEPPIDHGDFSGRPIPSDTNVAVTVVADDGASAFNPHNNRCCVKVTASAAPVWIDGTSTRWDPVTDTIPGAGDGDGIDVTEYLRSAPTFEVQDGPEGAVANLEIFLSAPVDGLDEVENRPIRLELVAHPDDTAAPATIVLLNGIGGPPEVVDGGRPEEVYVKIEVRDQLALLADARVTELVVFDDSDLCKPYPGQDSAIAVCLRQAGLSPSQIDLPDIDFKIEHQPPLKAGTWSFAAAPGALWWDVLKQLFDLAPSLVWGIRPRSTGPKFYVVDPGNSDASVATLYRTPEAAAGAGEEVDDAIGAFPALYADHSRKKLPREGNLVRVLGMDPASVKPLTAYRSDDNSRSPTGTKDAGWLGTTRTVAFESGTLTTQQMVEKVADSLAAAVAQCAYVESWRSFMLFLPNGEPVWRGDMVTLADALPGGGHSEMRVSSIRPDIVDEHGGGLATSEGQQAPVSIRVASYTGGALVGLGGTGPTAIAKRHHSRRENGRIGQGAHRIPEFSPFSS